MINHKFYGCENLPQRTSKQHHITLRDDTNTLERIEFYKKKLNLKSFEDVIDHYIPKTETDFFLFEWENFKQLILKYIPENSSRREFLQSIEALYIIGIVNGNKVSCDFINNFIKEFGDKDKKR
jgi:predicted CopG family antitoxin